MFPWQTPQGERNKWRHVRHDVRDAIINRHYGPGDRLPTEAQLVAAYGYSRNPIRQAMKSLENDGVIEIGEGSRGTWVASNAYDKLGIPPRAAKDRTTVSEAGFSGSGSGAAAYAVEEPDIDIYPGDRLTVRQATAGEARKLGLGPTEPLVYLQRKDGTQEVYRARNTLFVCQEPPPASDET